MMKCCLLIAPSGTALQPEVNADRKKKALRREEQGGECGSAILATFFAYFPPLPLFVTLQSTPCAGSGGMTNARFIVICLLEFYTPDKFGFRRVYHVQASVQVQVGQINFHVACPPNPSPPSEQAVTDFKYESGGRQNPGE